MPDSPSETLKARAPSLLMETSQEHGTLSLLEREQGWQAWGVPHGFGGEAVQFGQVRKGRT